MSFWTKCFIILGIIIGGMFLLAKSGERNNNLDKYEGGDNDKLLRAVKSESKIKEAIITEAHVLYVSVVDDGTNRNGYAEYVCNVVKDYNTDVNRIKVVKYNSNNDSGGNAYGTLLGECWCK